MNTPQWLTRILLWIRRTPSARSETAVWVILIVATVALRFYLIHLLPGYLWSKDAGSYANPVFDWMQQGDLKIDGRRGPVYTLFIALCLKWWGSMNSVMLAQHLLGVVAVILILLTLRAQFKRNMLWPFALCGIGYAVYGIPLYFEQLIRNETLLFFFSSVALASWFFAMEKKSLWLFGLAGLSAGLLTLTKNVFAPFPLVVIASIFWIFREERPRIVTHGLAFILALALPFISTTIHQKNARRVEPPQPQAGILLFGRVAQFTKLDGGIEPELKEVIREDIVQYRKLPKLDNNFILYRSAVPHIREFIKAKNQTPADVNRVCRNLAVEAIKNNPTAYARQVLRDASNLLLKNGRVSPTFKGSDVQSVVTTLEKQSVEVSHPSMEMEKTVSQLKSRANSGHFKTLNRITNWAWPFLVSPVLLSTVFTLFLSFYTRGTKRFFWIGGFSLMLFTIILLSTVGRPMDRYLIPVIPIMFLSISATLLVFLDSLVAKLDSAKAVH